MWFLYVVLGWCSFVGLAVMIILAPVPTWIATLTNAVQKEKMRATDARVQDVTESQLFFFSFRAHLRYLLENGNADWFGGSDEYAADDQDVWMGKPRGEVYR